MGKPAKLGPRTLAYHVKRRDKFIIKVKGVSCFPRYFRDSELPRKGQICINLCSDDMAFPVMISKTDKKFCSIFYLEREYEVASRKSFKAGVNQIVCELIPLGIQDIVQNLRGRVKNPIFGK